jgi:hypothetical protein
MRRVATGLAIALITLAAAGPVGAASPETELLTFTTDPYLIAECDGYDVLEQDDVSIRILAFFDRNGDFVREVFHSTTSGVVWRSDTGELVATYSDAGGTFTATAQNSFTWTGVHNEWTLTDGTVIRDVGRVVVAEVAPGEFERTFEAGRIPEPDPCSW